MWPSLVLLFLLLFVVALLFNGWVFQRAARFVGVEITLSHAVGSALAAGIAQAFAQLLVALLVIGSSDAPLVDTLVQDQGILRITSFVFGVATWTAITSVLLDVDLWKAAVIGVLSAILQVVLAIAVAITLFNVMLLLGMAALIWA